MLSVRIREQGDANGASGGIRSRDVLPDDDELQKLFPVCRLIPRPSDAGNEEIPHGEIVNVGGMEFLVEMPSTPTTETPPAANVNSKTAGGSVSDWFSSMKRRTTKELIEHTKKHVLRRQDSAPETAKRPVVEVRRRQTAKSPTSPSHRRTIVEIETPPTLALAEASSRSMVCFDLDPSPCLATPIGSLSSAASVDELVDNVAYWAAITKSTSPGSLRRSNTGSSALTLVEQLRHGSADSSVLKALARRISSKKRKEAKKLAVGNRKLLGIFRPESFYMSAFIMRPSIPYSSSITFRFSIRLTPSEYLLLPRS